MVENIKEVRDQIFATHNNLDENGGTIKYESKFIFNPKDLNEFEKYLFWITLDSNKINKISMIFEKQKKKIKKGYFYHSISLDNILEEDKEYLDKFLTIFPKLYSIDNDDKKYKN